MESAGIREVLLLVPPRAVAVVAAGGMLAVRTEHRGTRSARAAGHMRGQRDGG